jgi:hypothetical protein
MSPSDAPDGLLAYGACTYLAVYYWQQASACACTWLAQAFAVIDLQKTLVDLSS